MIKRIAVSVVAVWALFGVVMALFYGFIILVANHPALVLCTGLTLSGVYIGMLADE